MKGRIFKREFLGENKKHLKQKGITLIALVITIIVLLILAGVTIATLTGENGILTKATEANEETIKAKEQEQVDLAVSAIRGDDAYTGNNTLNATNLKNEIEKLNGEGTVEVTGEKTLTIKFLDTENTYQVNTVSNKLSEIVSVGDYVNYGKDLGIFVDEYGSITEEGGEELKWRVCYIDKSSGIVRVTTKADVGIGNELLDETVATNIGKISREDMTYLENVGAITVTEKTEEYEIFEWTTASGFLSTSSPIRIWYK